MLHQKPLDKKQKIVIYASAAAAAVVAAVGAVLAVVQLVKKPPAFVLNSSSASYMSASAFSAFEDSQGIEALKEDTVINGIKNGATYYTTQYVTVNDSNLKSVTVNGEGCGKAFLINGNSEKTYEIVALKHDGSRTVFTVYTKPTASMFELFGNITEATVTADNTKTIKQIQSTALQNGTLYSTPDEAAVIDDVLGFCDKLIKKISAVKAEVNRVEKAVIDYENKSEAELVSAELLQTEDDINRLIATSNLTDTQKNLLTDLKLRCQNLLLKVQQAQENILQTE